MLTKHLTKIGDSTGIIIDRPILSLLGLERGDEVQLRVEGSKLIIERATEADAKRGRRAKLAKAKARMHEDIGDTLEKLAK
ncbi:MAG: AbrB/MazE/SpoVT family DNA-binding domain-containing protein [Byssovorax sp.]